MTRISVFVTVSFAACDPVGGGQPRRRPVPVVSPRSSTCGGAGN